LVEIHPDDAARLDIADGALARVSTPRGESLYRAAVTDAQRPGDLFVPIHWTDRGSTGGRTGLLPRPLVDPHSGQPGFKTTPAAIAAVATEWRGFLLMRGEPGAMPDCLWATRVAVPQGTLWELAGDGDAAAIERLLPQGDRIEAVDPAKGSRRIAMIRDGRLAALLFVTSEGVLPSRDWLIAQLAAPAVAPTLLAGRAPGPSVDRGPIVCVCFDIGARAITDAIRADGLADVAAVGAALRAGTNCGSCRPAIAGLIADHANRESINASR
jgi:assimilatory nitrate reductase catalytic subunit